MLFKKKEPKVLTPEQEAKRRKFVKIRFCITAILLLGVIIFNINFRFVVISGDSMEPNFHDGSIFLARKRFDLFRFDVAIINENSDLIIKRVIGLPNETIECKDNVIYINDEPIVDLYAKEGSVTEDFGPITLKSDEFYCLGDNREKSADSRKFGAFKKAQIFAKLSVSTDRETDDDLAKQIIK